MTFSPVSRRARNELRNEDSSGAIDSGRGNFASWGFGFALLVNNPVSFHESRNFMSARHRNGVRIAEDQPVTVGI
jgi:hypothetical protein